MATATNQYRPDYAVPPGWVIEEHLAVYGISNAELARRCGRSAKLMSEIIAGKAPVEPKTALQLEKVLGVDARIWLGIEADYRLHRERKAETKAARADKAWANSFPTKELVNLGAISPPPDDRDDVSALLSFFGVASIETWQLKYGAANVAYRHSPSFNSDECALATWLRLAEIEARHQEPAEYSASAFKTALKQVRRLTREHVDEALKETQNLCNSAGVALALVKPLPKVRLSGAAWWLSPSKPVIALSARHKTNDHLWFSLFHEAAHIVLHSKKSVFVDGANNDGNTVETEANAWASDFLVSRSTWRQFVEGGDFRMVNVSSFAGEQGIAPGIVVGKLQHQGLLPWNRLNRLKIRLRWKDE